LGITIINFTMENITTVQLVLAIPSLVCLVLVIKDMFAEGKTGLGVACIVLTFLCGIGSLIAFVWGWMNTGGKVMVVWTALWIASLVAGVVGF
jgi:hypothetical protein